MREQITSPLSRLTVYRNLLREPLMQSMKELLGRKAQQDSGWVDCYGEVYYALTADGYDTLGDWLNDHLRYDESAFAVAAAKGEETDAMIAAARHDTALLNRCVLSENWEELRQTVQPPLPAWKRGADCDPDELLTFYHTHGCGEFARYRAFVWQDGSLIPVRNPDCVPTDEMIGYERQRDQVKANTFAMLAGHRVNNMLLYGMSGTGKSATVKSLLSVEGMENLRIIEVDKTDLGGIPELVRMLGHQPQKFILFIDDLAFDKDDKNYSLLKTILEGGVEPRPANVAVYATSNRRHLVRETFSDRMGDEVDATETIQEKTSLAERFGLRVLYQELTKPQFMNLIKKLAKVQQIKMDEEEMMALAVRWDVRNHSRSPRSALQFLASLSARF